MLTEAQTDPFGPEASKREPDARVIAFGGLPIFPKGCSTIAKAWASGEFSASDLFASADISLGGNYFLAELKSGNCVALICSLPRERAYAGLTQLVARGVVSYAVLSATGELLTEGSVLERSREAAHSLTLLDQIDRFRNSSGRDKIAARAQLVTVLRTLGSRTADLGGALERLISMPRSPGCLGDAVDVLCELGDLTRALANRSLAENSPNGANDDYWYVLIRALGKTASADIVRMFIDSPYRTLREATAEALRDLRDEASLQKMASLDGSQFIRETARELIDELREGTPST